MCRDGAHHDCSASRLTLGLSSRRAWRVISLAAAYAVSTPDLIRRRLRASANAARRVRIRPSAPLPRKTAHMRHADALLIERYWTDARARPVHSAFLARNQLRRKHALDIRRRDRW